MALIFCTECGKKVSDSAKACPGCGFPISEYLNKKKCPECGEYISDNDSVCGNCGFPLKEDEGKENKQSQSEDNSMKFNNQSDSNNDNENNGSENNWFYVSNGIQSGPFSEQTMINKFNRGEINEDTFVWLVGTSAWQVYKDSRLYKKRHMKRDEEKVSYNQRQNPTGDTTVKTSALTQQVIKNLIFSVRIVGVLWLIVGIIQFGISCYINSLYKSFEAESIIAGIWNMCWGVGRFIIANNCDKNKTTIWNSCRIGVLDVICYIWNGIVVITTVSIGGEYTILAIVALAAILVEAIAVKRVIYVYKDEFSAMANMEAEKEEAIENKEPELVNENKNDNSKISILALIIGAGSLAVLALVLVLIFQI